jgi:hypothetical protein
MADEAILLGRRNRFQQRATPAGNDRRPACAAAGQTRSSVMSVLINLFYREYCRARLMEMRKHHLIATN